MKKIFLTLFVGVFISILSFGQTVSKLFQKADSAYFDFKDYKTAIDLYKKVKLQLKDVGKDYEYTVDKIAKSLFYLEYQVRDKGEFVKSMELSKEFIDLVEKEGKYVSDELAKKKYWMIKNIAVANFILEKPEDFKKYKEILYKGYQDKTLPNGLDEYFNYDFFKLKDKNIWGYEWYPEIPENRLSSSFTKVVYYVYSTNADGSDKEQLYRFHVLMFHQSSQNTKFDYILERQVDTDSTNVSGSYYQYTYKKDIDYKKLKTDIIEIVTKEIEPSSRRVVHTSK